MCTRAKILFVVFLFSWTLIPGSASADDVTLTGTISFNSLDGSAEDHDGAVNGVFTVNDGDLVIEGTVQCNDDPPLSGNAGACAIAINVSGDLTVEAGGAIFAENRLGGGAGGNISLTVGGNLILQGPSGALAGAIVSSSRLTGRDSAGSITLAVQGNVSLEAGSAVAASTPNGSAGAIGITAGGTVSMAGLVASGPSRQVLGTKLTGKILDGGESKQTGGTILVQATEILVEGSGIIVAQGESSGSQVVQFDACDIQIRGLVASVLKQNGPSQVVLRSGEGLVIDGRDLGTSGPSLGRFGRVRADGTEGGSAGYMVDLFANDDIEVLGPVSSSLFAVSSSPGPIAQRSGGAITAISLAGALTASGNAFEAGKSTTGNQGGIIDLKAKEDATLDGATLRAIGDHLTTASSRKGGSISVRSYQGSVSWTFGVGDVRPTGSGVSASRRGSITLTACTGIDTTGTQFPTVGAAVPPFPVENEGVCAPAAPNLPSGEPPLPVCNQPPVANDDAYTVAEDGTLNQAAPGVLGNDTDPDADPLTAVLVSGPSHASSFTLNTDGSFTYEHDGSETTSDTFTYKANDGSSSSNTATVTITVTPVDDPPTAVDDAATVAEDSGANAIDVLANDTDPDGGAISVASVTQPVNGTVAITGGGTGLTYTPNANYCNTPPGTALDTFTYTLSPGGDTATVTVTVNCADDAPTAVNDAATVAEDSGANPINVQANDTDPDGGTNTITAVTQPANGAVAITNGGADLTYTPNANYCNTPPGTALDAFTYTLSPGGTVATVTVTVTCVDDNPVAVMDAATVAEDSGANTINVLANDTDVDAGPISITSVTQPANGAVVITNGGTDLTYAPGANYCNNPPGTTPDTFTYTLSPGGSTATVSVTVTCVNDGPSIDLDANDDQGTTGSDFAVTFTEGDAAKLIQDPLDATVADIDNTTLASLTVTITNLLDAEDETLSADVTGTSITANYVAATGVLTLTGPDTLANFEAVLRTVRYQNTDNAPDPTPRVIHFVANDGTADGNTAVSTVTVVPVDTAPTAVDDAATVNEDSGANAIDVLANDTDPDGGAISVASVTQPTNGTVAITGGGTGLTYTPNANYCNSVSGGPDTFTYTLSPGNSTATVSVTVTCVDDNPTAVADAATVVEDSTNNPIDVLANDTDSDGGTKLVTAINTAGTNGTVAIVPGGTGVTYTPNANYCNTQPGGTPDTFTYTITGGSTATVSVTVTCVDDDPVAVADAATVVEDSSGNILNVLANDTDVDGGAISIQSVTQPANGSVTNNTTNVTYTPNPNYCNNPPGTTLDTFSYTLTPGGSSTTVTVTVTCVDDPPVAVNDSATVLEDSGATSVPVLANDTDPDAGPISITSVTQPTNGTVVITGGGTGLTYAPKVNYCNNPSGTPDTFTYTLTPGGSTATVTVTVTCVNDPPVAAPDAFDFIGNTDLVVDLAALATPHALETTPSTFGVVDGDSDPVENNAISVTAITVGACTDASAPLDCSDPAVGRVQMQSNGRFIFTPAPGDAGATETFQYTLTDNGVPAPASAIGTVTLTRFERVWYVKNDAPAGGNGTSSSPFNSITPANLSDNDSDGDLTDDLDSAGDYIFVYLGTGTTANQAGGLVLENGQHLIGQHAGLSLNVNLNGNGAPTNLVAAAAGSRPLLDDTVVDAFEGVSARNVIPAEIVGMNLAGNVNAIDWTTTAAFSGTGTFTIRDNVISSAAGDGVDINLAGTSGVDLAFHDNNLTSAGTALDIQETGTGSLTIRAFDDNVVSGNSGGSGIVISNATFDSVPGGGLNTVNGGTTVIGASGNGVSGAGMALGNVQGDLHFTGNLNIFADGGAGLTVTGAGAGMQFRVNSGGAPTGIIEATGGPAVDAAAAAFDLRLTSLKSTNSASTGVSLTNVTGTFSAETGSSITNSTGTDFAISGGTANVTYRGTITDDVGQLVSVSGATAGTKSFEGAITDGDDGDGSGVSLSSNTGATVRFSGGLILSTGGNAAFAATGGGTVEVCDENPCNGGATGGLVNRITTTTGTALNVANTTIGASHLEFRSISAGTVASGPANGIVVNNTGSSGGLKVKGTGAAGSGGTIQNTTGDGISLTSTAAVSLSFMNIQNGGEDGIDGTSVNGFSVASSNVTNNGNAANEEGVSLANVSGAVSMTSTAVTSSAYNNLRIDNTTGTVSLLNISGSSFNNNDVGIGNHGALIEIRGTSQLTTASITGSSFSGNEVMGIQVATGDTAVVSNFVLNGNTITNNELGIDFSKAQTSNLTFAILNNTGITGQNSHGINLFTAVGAGTTGLFQGRIEGNTIGNSGVAGSGSAIGNCIRVNINGDADATVLVNNNTIRQCPNGRGIEVIGRNGTGGLDVTVTNNDVNPQAPSDPLAAILVQSNCATVCNTVRTDVRGNTVPAGPASDLLPTYIALVETSTSTLQLVDTAPASATCTEQLTTNNTGSASASPGCTLIAGPISTP
jgi:VCBS repeat-containing protein